MMAKNGALMVNSDSDEQLENNGQQQQFTGNIGQILDWWTYVHIVYIWYVGETNRWFPLFLTMLVNILVIN